MHKRKPKTKRKTKPNRVIMMFKAAKNRSNIVQRNKLPIVNLKRIKVTNNSNNHRYRKVTVLEVTKKNSSLS